MLPFIKQFRDDLFRANSSLNKLMLEASRHTEGGLMAELLDLNNRLSELQWRSGEILFNMPKPEAPAADIGEKSPSTAEGETAAPREDYPKFFKADEKLVKIGRSDKKGREYRHACGFEAVKRLVSLLAASTADGRPIRVSDALDSMGGGITNSQIYTAVDWLQAAGLLKKHGKRGYSLEEVEDPIREVEARFRQLPEPQS